jgi:hypothetical protein
VLEVSFFFLELRVCRGESSVAMPRAQVNDLISLSEGRMEEELGSVAVERSSLPR